jgi:hypothetical protein
MIRRVLMITSTFGLYHKLKSFDACISLVTMICIVFQLL